MGPCEACGEGVTVRRERHHVIPRSAGGRRHSTVVLCVACHDMVDRCRLGDWHISEAVLAVREVSGAGAAHSILEWRATGDDWRSELAGFTVGLFPSLTTKARLLCLRMVALRARQLAVA